MLFEIGKICTEHDSMLNLFLRSWRSKWEIMAVNTPKLKLLLVLEQSRSWGSVDQELHQCSYLAETLYTTYYSNSYVLWISWFIPCFLEMGLTRISSLVLGGWEIEPSPEYFLPPVQFPISEFCKFFQKWFKIPRWYSQVAQGVWSSWSDNLTIFFLL